MEVADLLSAIISKSKDVTKHGSRSERYCWSILEAVLQGLQLQALRDWIIRQAEQIKTASCGFVFWDIGEEQRGAAVFSVNKDSQFLKPI